MKTTRHYRLVVLAGIGMALWIYPSYGLEHEHDGHGAAKLSLNDGKRWETDAPLRAGMQRIRDAVAPVLAAYELQSVTAEQAKNLAAAINDDVTYLIQNCKLVPEADKTLHALIVDLVGGATALSADPLSEEGMHRLVSALHQYPVYFDDPGWSALPSSHPEK